MKWPVTRAACPALIALFDKHKDGKGKQAKLKTPGQLQELLDVTKELQLQGRRAAPATDPVAAEGEVCARRGRGGQGCSIRAGGGGGDLRVVQRSASASCSLQQGCVW